METENSATGSVNPQAETEKTPAPEQSTPSVKPPATPSGGRPRTERPVEPRNPTQPFTREEEAPIGNPKALAALRLEGQLGIFYDRANTTRSPSHVEMNMTNFRDAVIRVLQSVLAQEMYKEGTLDAPTITQEITSIATTLSDGTCVLTYLKLKNTNYHDTMATPRFRKQPKVPAHFEVPQPYALAISQLGQIKISGTPTEHYLTPVFTAEDGANIGLPAGRRWNPAAYAQAVERAKKIGIRFSTVDLSVKMGSAWWLYRPRDVQDVHVELVCPYPEENFTENTAVLATLFCIGADATVHNPIIRPAPLGVHDFGTMARLPFPDVALNTYYAICDVKEIDYTVVN